MKSKHEDKSGGTQFGGVTRRDFIGASAKTVTAGAAITAFPSIVRAADPVRAVGLGVSVADRQLHGPGCRGNGRVHDVCHVLHHRWTQQR